MNTDSLIKYPYNVSYAQDLHWSGLDENLNVLNDNLSVLENLLEQNETEFTDFISKFGTRKMKKNLQTIETEEVTPELTNK